MGALAFWTPKYLVEEMHMDIGLATYGIGAVTVSTGIIGAAFGGWISDFLTPPASSEHNVNVSNTTLALIVLVCCSLSLPLASLAFASTDTVYFFVLMFCGEFLFFAATSPINGLSLRYHQLTLLIHSFIHSLIHRFVVLLTRNIVRSQ